MLNSLAKTASVAVALLTLSVGAASAAQYATVNHDTPIRNNYFSGAPLVGWASEDDDVKVLTCVNANGGWCKINDAGDIGWVKKSRLDLYSYTNPGPGMQACFNGPLGYVCINGN